MTEQPGTAADSEWLVSAERQLHLLDQVIGLRAELAEGLVRSQTSAQQQATDHEHALDQLHEVRLADADLRAQLASATGQLVRLRGSLTWKIGRLVTRPVAGVLRWVRGRRSS